LVNVVVWALVSGHRRSPGLPLASLGCRPVWVVLFAVSAGVTLFRRSLPPATRLQPANG
jgi:hypothetical protein